MHPFKSIKNISHQIISARFITINLLRIDLKILMSTQIMKSYYLYFDNLKPIHQLTIKTH